MVIVLLFTYGTCAFK